jgi:hypothetical protein
VTVCRSRESGIIISNVMHDPVWGRRSGDDDDALAAEGFELFFPLNKSTLLLR